MVMSSGLFQSIENFETGTRVEEALVSFDKSRFDRVSAVVFFGIVELSGVVSSYYDKALAMRIAKGVAGVTTVVETIQIYQINDITRPRTQWRPRPVPFYQNVTNNRVIGRPSLSNR